MSLESLIQTYGYAALVIGTVFEGETLLVIAGFAAHRGYLSLPGVCTIAFITSFLVDQLWFYLGRRKGRGFMASRPAWETRARTIQAWLGRYQWGVVVGFRFAYGFRTITPLVLGATGFPPARFLVLNAVGALLWSVLLGGAGYAFGHAMEVLLEDVRRYEPYLIAVLVLIGAAVWGFRRVRRWRSAQPATLGLAQTADDAGTGSASRGGDA